MEPYAFVCLDSAVILLNDRLIEQVELFQVDVNSSAAIPTSLMSEEPVTIVIFDDGT